ncbi:MAG: acyltransferase family protein [Microbacterium pygmaeum]
MSAAAPADAGAARSVPRRDIQGLRAIAVLAVVSAHVVGWPRGGFVGVDVFFVVSGFLITDLLLRELALHGRISLRRFYARRVRRILPAALLVLVVVTIAAFAVFNRPRADQTLGDAIAAALLVSNWRFAAQGTDYFHAADAVSPLQHFWTLSVEEQFYLVWPGLILLTVLLTAAIVRRRRRVRATVGTLALLVAGASLGWAFVQTATDPTVAYFSTATRAWELAAGALLAVASPVLVRMPAVLGSMLAWVGLAGVIGAFLAIDPDTMPFPAPWALLPVIATALVIAGGLRIHAWRGHLFPLTNPISVFVGDVSYSLYLWHFPVIVFAAVLLPAGAVTTVVVLLVIALLSVTTYFMLEQPIHRSPWLTGTSEPATAANAQPVTTQRPASRAVPAAPTLSTRPAGWTPGTRYYPGSRPSAQRPVGRAAVATAAPDAFPATRTAPAAAEPPETIPPWTAWRARFGTQIGISAAVLGVGAGAVLLVLQLTLAPFAGAGSGPDAAPDDPGTSDPVAAVQAELSTAIAATSWPQLDPTLDQVIARSSSDNPARDCFVPDESPDLDRCTWGSADAPRHMYLVGDSSAMAYAPAFKAIAEGSGGAWRITTVGLYGCRFTDVLVDNSDPAVVAACPQRKRDVREMIAASPADLVVVANAYTLGHAVDGRDLSAGDLISATQAEVGSYAASAGVVYLSPPPHGADLARCYSPVTAPSACLSAVEPTWHDMQAAAAAVASATGGWVVDALPFTCVQEVCPAFAGTLPIRYDATHLTVAYAEHIAPILQADLLALGLF